MNIPNQAPKINNISKGVNWENIDPTFKIPSHVRMIVLKLFAAEDPLKLNKVLAYYADNSQYDENLKELYNELGWDHETKTFQQQTVLEDVLSKIEKIYGLSLSCLSENYSKIKLEGRTENYFRPSVEEIFDQQSSLHPWTNRNVTMRGNPSYFKHGAEPSDLPDYFLSNSAKALFSNKLVVRYQIYC